jgi:site-specific recombinase XerD
MSQKNQETIADFLAQCRTVARLRHLAYSTEQSDVATIRRFICFHGRKYPSTRGNFGAEEIRIYLSHRAAEGRVATSTQKALGRPYSFSAARCRNSSRPTSRT